MYLGKYVCANTWKIWNAMLEKKRKEKAKKRKEKQSKEKKRKRKRKDEWGTNCLIEIKWATQWKLRVVNAHSKL